MSILVHLDDSDKKEVEDVNNNRHISYGSKTNHQNGCFYDYSQLDRGNGSYAEKGISKASGQEWNKNLWSNLSSQLPSPKGKGL